MCRPAGEKSFVILAIGATSRATSCLLYLFGCATFTILKLTSPATYIHATKVTFINPISVNFLMHFLAKHVNFDFLLNTENLRSHIQTRAYNSNQLLNCQVTIESLIHIPPYPHSDEVQFIDKIDKIFFICTVHKRTVFYSKNWFARFTRECYPIMNLLE